MSILLILIYKYISDQTLTYINQGYTSYDANPVNLNPLEPAESAKKWTEYMELGSVDDVIRKAKEDFDKGEYQWVAEITNNIVYSDPENKPARLLCADALEQRSSHNILIKPHRTFLKRCRKLQYY